MVAELKLSERNLLALLVKLYQDGSQVTIYNNVVDVAEGFPDSIIFKLVAEKDDVHYDDAARGGAQGAAGRMNPGTEEFAAKVKAYMEAIHNPLQPFDGSGMVNIDH